MISIRLLLAASLLLVASAAADAANALPSAPAAATRRSATVQVRVAPEHADWTYRLGEPAHFRIVITADNQPLDGVQVTYKVGPELMPAQQKEVTVPADGLVIDGGTMKEPGFLRCIVTTEFAGRSYRGVATAGFAPDVISPTQTEPADFDQFWADGKAELAREPIDPQLTLVPEQCTSEVNVYHVSFRVVGGNSDVAHSRIYGMLAEPTKPGRYPAVLRVPGAGIRPYKGDTGLAARGIILLDIGIHGIPVNLPQSVYDQLYVGGLSGYSLFNLDDRRAFYFRRVYLGCLRANDFLVTRPGWNSKDLVVMGGSQGGMLSIVTAALDPRVTGLCASYPGGCDLTGDLHGRTGGWPHPFAVNSQTGAASPNATPARIATTAYYDTVNFARRLKVPGHFAWGYNDEVCPPTSLHAAYNVISSPKELTLLLEMGHASPPELWAANNAWLTKFLGLK